MKSFKELGLSHEVIEVLDKAGIKEPTEIQEKTIPLAIAGKDVIGGSATGSGKTLAFSSGIIENLKSNGYVQALILTPTRELAEQVADSIKKFSRNKRLDVIAVYGGVDITAQMRKIAIADIIVATPGRVLDHIKRSTLRLDHVQFLVLDEVDRMFDMGFHKDVEEIIKRCPKKRQTMLFSATISPEIDHLAKKHTHEAVEISVQSYIDASKLVQTYYDVPSAMKFSLLIHLLKQERNDIVMIFCGTRRNVDFVADNLNNCGIDAKAIHGGLVQNKRIKILNEFHGKGVKVLVCTDVAARGLDIKGVTHVYNYDLPKSSDDYIHRIGRTARAGTDGKAVSLLSDRDYDNFSNILRDENLKIEQEKLPYLERVNIKIPSGRDRDGDRGSGNNFNRGSSRGGRFGSSSGRSYGGGSGRSYGRSGGSRGRDDSKRDDRAGPRGHRSTRGGRDNSRGKKRYFSNNR